MFYMSHLSNSKVAVAVWLVYIYKKNTPTHTHLVQFGSFYLRFNSIGWPTTNHQWSRQTSSVPISSWYRSPGFNLQDSQTQGTHLPPADQPSSFLKGTIRESLFHREWPFIMSPGTEEERHQSLGEWFKSVDTHTQKHTLCMDLATPRGASIASSSTHEERVLMSYGWQFINRFMVVFFYLILHFNLIDVGSNYLHL